MEVSGQEERFGGESADDGEDRGCVGFDGEIEGAREEGLGEDFEGESVFKLSYPSTPLLF